MPAKALNVGVIGYGFMGRAHANAYAKVNHFFDLKRQCVLKAACGRDAAKTKAFADQCREWIKAGAESMEKKLWNGSYYLNYSEPETGKKSDLVFGYQMDGEWITDHHGLPSGLPLPRS